MAGSFPHGSDDEDEDPLQLDTAHRTPVGAADGGQAQAFPPSQCSQVLMQQMSSGLRRSPLMQPMPIQMPNVQQGAPQLLTNQSSIQQDPQSEKRKSMPPADAKASKKRPKKKEEPLPPELAAFRIEHKTRIAFGEELDTACRDKQSQSGPWRVAQTTTTGSEDRGTLKMWQLKDLKSNQIRTLAQNMGCTKVGSLSKFLCRKEMARRCDLGVVYDQVNLPSVRTTAQEKKTNALFRIVNTCFLPENFDKLRNLNDGKKRKDFEEAGGGSPAKAFWTEIAEQVNDSEQEEVGLVLWAEDDEDVLLHKWAKEGVINLADYTQQTWQSCAQSFADLMKCRQATLKSKRESGEHSDDTMSYITGAKKHTTPRKNVTMPKEAVCCLCKHCDMQVWVCAGRE